MFYNKNSFKEKEAPDDRFGKFKPDSKTTLRAGFYAKGDGNLYPEKMAQLFTPHLKEQYKLTGDKASYLFLNASGVHYYDIKRIRDSRWKRLLKEMDITYSTIYHMRHSFATIKIQLKTRR